jgi:zinc transport system permease protein
VTGEIPPFLWRALVAGVGLAIVAAPLGCVVVWRRMAYAGETIAQASLLGVALGVVFKLDLTLPVIAAAVAAACLLIAFGRQKLLSLDSVLGLLHHATLALGYIAIAMIKGQGDLTSYLFGDILAVTNRDYIWVFGGGAIVLALTAYLWKDLVRLALHEDLAAAEGVRPARVRAAFDIMLAVTIAIAMKILGILLVMAFLIVPAVAARPLASTPERMALGAAGISVVSVVTGILLSFQYDVPGGGGPCIVLVMTAFAALSLMAARRVWR